MTHCHALHPVLEDRETGFAERAFAVCGTQGAPPPAGPTCELRAPPVGQEAVAGLRLPLEHAGNPAPTLCLHPVLRYTRKQGSWPGSWQSLSLAPVDSGACGPGSAHT